MNRGRIGQGRLGQTIERCQIDGLLNYASMVTRNGHGDIGSALNVGCCNCSKNRGRLGLQFRAPLFCARRLGGGVAFNLNFITVRLQPRAYLLAKCLLVARAQF